MDSAPRISEPGEGRDLGSALAERLRPRTSTLSRPPRGMLGAGSLARSSTDFGSLVGLSSTHRWALLRGFEHDDLSSVAAGQPVRPPVVEWPWIDDDTPAPSVRTTTASSEPAGGRPSPEPPVDFDPSIHRPPRRGGRDGTPVVFGDRRVDALLQAVKTASGGEAGLRSATEAGPATTPAATMRSGGTVRARRARSAPVRRGLPLVARRAPMGPDTPRRRPGAIAAAVQPEVVHVDPDSPVPVTGAGTPTRRPGMPAASQGVATNGPGGRRSGGEVRRPGRSLDDLHRVLVERGLIGPGGDAAEAAPPAGLAQGAGTDRAQGAGLTQGAPQGAVTSARAARNAPRGERSAATPGSVQGPRPTSAVQTAGPAPGSAAVADALPMAVLGRTPAPSAAAMAVVHRSRLQGSSPAVSADDGSLDASLTAAGSGLAATAHTSTTPPVAGAGVALLERGVGQLQRRARGAGVDWVPSQAEVPETPSRAAGGGLAAHAPVAAATAVATPPSGAPGVAARPGALFSAAPVMAPMSHRPLLAATSSASTRRSSDGTAASTPTGTSAAPVPTPTPVSPGIPAVAATTAGGALASAAETPDVGQASVRPPDAAPATAALADPVERFRQHLEQAPAPRTHELPRYFRPLATALVGDRPVRVASDATSRSALQAAGKVAATVGDTIHVARPLRDDRRDAALVAHELTHVAHPSPEPRFFDDDRKSAEEQLAEQMAAQVATTMWRRSGASGTRGASMPTLGAGRRGARGTAPLPAPSAIDRADDLKQVMEQSPVLPVATSASGQTAPPAPADSGSSGGTVSASALAASLTGSRRGGGAAPTARPPRPSTPPPALPSSTPSSSSTPAAPPSPAATPASAAAPDTASSTSPADPSTTSQQLDDFERLLELLEERVLAEIERRGGRFRGGF